MISSNNKCPRGVDLSRIYRNHQRNWDDMMEKERKSTLHEISSLEDSNNHVEDIVKGSVEY